MTPLRTGPTPMMMTPRPTKMSFALDLERGALITAKHAMEQGREVFAVPGQVDRPGSSGPHRLLRDGAKLVT